MRSMLRELFLGLSSSVGHWPRSSAYYALDVLYDNHANTNGSGTAHTITPTTNIETTSSNNSNNSDSDSSSSSNSNSQYHPPVPKLVEINYMGDWKALKKITVLENEERRAREREKAKANPELFNLNPNHVDSRSNAAVSPTSIANPDSQRVSHSDCTSTTNHNSNPVGEIDEVMLEWVEDLLTVLSTSNPPHPDRCIPLHHNDP